MFTKSKIIILLIVLLVFIYIHQYTNINNIEKYTDDKPYLWVYWEHKKDTLKPPPYIQLCLNIIKKNSYLFNYIFLNEKTVYNYLPNLRSDINNLPLAMKTDYIRIALLYKYGGLWLDADTIMMTDLQPIISILNSGVDFIGFNCTGEICFNGYGKPSNSAMASKKNGLLMKSCMNILNLTLNNYFSGKQTLKYHTLGKYILWDNIKYLERIMNYKYYHYPLEGVGTRDINGKWVTKDIIFEKNIKLLNKQNLILILLANNIYCGNNKTYNWFCKLSINDILSGKYYISTLYIQALNYKNKKIDNK